MQLFALLFVAAVAHAQPAPAQSNFSQPELDQMLAPVALYPDALLSQILMASTYPTEVTEAAYWLRANPGLQGENAVKAAEGQQWDISVKSLLPFPQILNTMESKVDWTTNLGNAFLGQEQQVMDTIQSLRGKAMAAGYLKSDNRVRVVQDNQLISINLVSPTAVYVPYYNPTVVYGTWWAPSYAPVYWDPWPGYVVGHGHYGWAWAPVATAVTVGVLYAAFNWHSHRIYQYPHVSYWRHHYHYDYYRYRGPSSYWVHDARHRRDIPYRSAVADRRFGTAARNYNTRVGPRPGMSDIRAGHYRPAVVTRTGAGPSRTANPYAGFRPSAAAAPAPGRTPVAGRAGTPPAAGTAAPTGRAPVAGKAAPGATAPAGMTGRQPLAGKAATTPSAAGTNPPGVAHGVRGTQPGLARGARGTQPSATQANRPTVAARPAAANRPTPAARPMQKPAPTAAKAAPVAKPAAAKPVAPTKPTLNKKHEK